MTARFPLVVNPVTRKIEELQEIDSLELTGNGISISGSLGTNTQYLKSTGSLVTWGNPLVELSALPSFSLNNLSVTGTLSSTGNLTVGGSSGIATSLTVGTDASIGGDLSVTQDTVLFGTLDVASDIITTGSLSIGTSIQAGTNLSAGGSLSVTTNATVGGTLGVTSSATIGGTLQTGGTITVDGSYLVKDNGGTVQFKTNATTISLNDQFTTGTPLQNAALFVRRGSETPTSIRWNEIDNRWQFTNDGVQYYNILLPTETVSAAADEFGASADPNRYNISSTQTVVDNSQSFLQVQLEDASDIQFFTLSHQVKIFGASVTASGDLPLAPVIGTTTYTASNEQSTFDDDTIPHSFYAYAVAAFRLDNGDISPATVVNTIVENLASDRMNEANYNGLIISRVSGTGILLYRGEFSTQALAQAAINDFSGVGGTQFKLINILATKEFPSDSLTTQFTDYGSYDIPLWTTKKNSDGTFKQEIHFPLTPPQNSKRGWAVGSVRDINGIDGTFRIDLEGLTADTNGNQIYLYHDDTKNIQSAIDQTALEGRNYLIIPGGTYLLDHIKLPSGFTLGGLNDATVFKKQYWATTNINSVTYEGLKNAMFFSDTFDAVASSDTWTLSDFTLRDLVIDGNGENQILYDVSSLGEETNNCVIGLPNSSFVRLINLKIRNTSGPVLFAEGSTNMQISGSAFLDGMQTERYGTPCLLMSDCENTTIGSSFFRNFPGALDFTTNQVLAMSGNVIRSCGAGIQIYGSVNTDVLDNIILGPNDEYIPVPDLYDTDYDGVNISVYPGIESQTPVYQYQSEGENVDLSATIINFDVYQATVSGGVETVDLNNPLSDVQFQYFNPVDVNLDPQDDITVGQIRFKLSSDQSSNVPSPSVDNYLVYSITGVDYRNIGNDIETVLDTGELSNDTPASYIVTVSNQNAFNALAIGDYVKLVSHDYNPDGGVTLWKILNKFVDTENKIELEPYQEDITGSLTLVEVTDVGSAITPGGGYLQLRETFVIAKGVISRVQ